MYSNITLESTGMAQNYYNNNIKYIDPYNNNYVATLSQTSSAKSPDELQRLQADPRRLFSDSQEALTLYKYGSDLLLRVSSFAASNYDLSQLESLQNKIQKNLGSNARLFISTLNCGGQNYALASALLNALFPQAYPVLPRVRVHQNQLTQYLFQTNYLGEYKFLDYVNGSALGEM